MAVHVLMIAHVLHWLSAGETITPIEPSESMETLRDGRINAGFIFFTAAVLATLFLGRWVCGWGCHLVAYQDLSLWVLKKLRLRPKAFQSRLLVFIPLLAALYMFVWPAASRWWFGSPRPAATWHLTTTGFWDTFPQYGIAALTVVVCGVAMIYFLGPKGFCTFACPYGAFFGLADKLALGRIRVTDACRQCGHCTSVCTSNVKVAEEVKLYKMVVDPGCMKCLDCVSVCPNDALYYGFGLPSLGKRPVAPRRPPRYDLRWSEEGLALLIFAGSFLAYRGLYGKFPFLMSLGVAAVVTYLLLKAVRLLHAPDVLIQRTRLKVAGRIQPAGVAYLAVILLLVALTVHSAVWRYHDYLGGRAFARSPAETFRWQYQPEEGEPRPIEGRESLGAGLGHLEFAERWALAATPENDLKMTWLYLQNGASGLAAERLRSALSSAPSDPLMWLHLAKVETLRGHLSAAREAFGNALARESAERDDWRGKLGDRPMPGSALLWSEWGMFLAFCGEADAALAAMSWAVAYDPASLPAWLALADFQLRMDQIDAARRSLIAAVRLAPGPGPADRALRALAKLNQSFYAASDDYAAAIRENPGSAALHSNRAYALTELQRYQDAKSEYETALELRGDALDVRADLGALFVVLGDLAASAKEYERILDSRPTHAEAAIRLGYLYIKVGRTQEAAGILRIAAEHGDPRQRQDAITLLNQLGDTQPPAK